MSRNQRQLARARREVAAEAEALKNGKGSELALHEAKQKVRWYAGGVNDNGKRPNRWW